MPPPRERYPGGLVDPPTGNALGPTDVKVYVYRRNADGTAGALASSEVYTTPNGSTPVTYPLVPDSSGHLAAHAEGGAYLIRVRNSGDTATLYDEFWDANPNRTGQRLLPHISGVEIYGHSLGAGQGATNVDFDIGTRLASMLRAQERNYSISGAVLTWQNSGITGDGGFTEVLQRVVRRSRPGATITAATTVGGTTFTVSTANAAKFSTGDGVLMGSGASAETKYITAINTGTGVITVDSAWATAWAIGTVVYRTTGGDGGHRVGATPAYVYWFGLNDLGRTTNVQQNLQIPFQNALRTIISRARSFAVFEEDTVTFGANWGGVGNNAINSGIGVMQTVTNGSVFTITTPSDFEGGTIAIVTPASQGAGGIVSYALDGVAVGSLDTRTLSNEAGKTNTGCFRIAVPAGKHTIVGTVNSITSAFTFDCWMHEAPDPPVVCVVKPHRPMSYGLYNGFANQQINTTIAVAGVGAGATSVNVANATGMAVGQTITFSPGTGGNEETRRITSITTNLVGFTPALSNNGHSVGEAVRVGVQDYDLNLMRGWFDTVVAEFTDGRVISVDPDPYIGAVPAAHSRLDLVHLTDWAGSVMADLIVDAIASATGPSENTAANGSTPTAPVPSEISFVDAAATATNAANIWTNLPAAVTELFGVTNGANRRKADLRRVVDLRLLAGISSNGTGSTATSEVRAQYSLDGGTTWKHFSRTAAFAEGTGPSIVFGAGTGLFDSGWVKVPEEAKVADCLIRIVGLGGGGTADPAFGYLALQFRG